jgi:hypothetical protein
MIKGLFLLLTLNLLLFFPVNAQETDSLKDTTAQTASSNYLFIGTTYQSRVNFMGRDFGQKIPLFSSDILFWHRTGLYVNATVAKFFVSDLSWQKGLGLGFSRDLSPKTDIDLSFNEFFGANNLNESGMDNIGMLQGTLGLDWGLLYSTTQLLYLFNQPSDFFLISRHSRYFELDQRFGKSGVLSFEPRLTFYLGTSNYYQIGGYELTSKQFLDTQRFVSQAVDLSVPISLNFSNLELQLEPRWVIPTSVPEYDLSSSHFQLALKATYAFQLKKTK